MRNIHRFICMYSLLLAPTLGAMDEPELSIDDDKVFEIYGAEGIEYKISVSWRILRLSRTLQDVITIFDSNEVLAIPLADFSQTALKIVFDVLNLHYFNIDNLSYSFSLFNLIKAANCACFLRVDDKVIQHLVRMLQSQKDAQSLSEDEFYHAIDEQLDDELQRFFAAALFEDLWGPLTNLCLNMRREIVPVVPGFERPVEHKAKFNLLSPDQRLIVSSMPRIAKGRQQKGQYEVRVADNKTGKLSTYIGVRQANSMMSLFNSDSTMLMICSEHLKTNNLSLWELKSSQQIFSSIISYSKVCSLAFSADMGSTLALCYDEKDQTTHLVTWDRVGEIKYIQDFDASFDLKNPRLSTDGAKIIGLDRFGRTNSLEFLSLKEIAALFECSCAELAKLNRLCQTNSAGNKTLDYLGEIAFRK